MMAVLRIPDDLFAWLARYGAQRGQRPDELLLELAYRLRARAETQHEQALSVAAAGSPEEAMIATIGDLAPSPSGALGHYQYTSEDEFRHLLFQ